MAPERLGQRPQRRPPGESLAALASLGIPRLATRTTSIRQPPTRNYVTQAVDVAPRILAADVQHAYFPAALHLARHMGQHPQVARPASLATKAVDGVQQEPARSACRFPPRLRRKKTEGLVASYQRPGPPVAAPLPQHRTQVLAVTARHDGIRCVAKLIPGQAERARIGRSPPRRTERMGQTRPPLRTPRGAARSSRPGRAPAGRRAGAVRRGSAGAARPPRPQCSGTCHQCGPPRPGTGRGPRPSGSPSHPRRRRRNRRTAAAGPGPPGPPPRVRPPPLVRPASQ